ncbi:MAG: hypothetical protein KA973_19215, partial [Candidatus Microthrix sp.]|nr:hypothetical protein [Candidatus Microthrix sp.]
PVVVSASRSPLGVFLGVHLTSLVDTILAGAQARFKMGWPDAYGPPAEAGSATWLDVASDVFAESIEAVRHGVR